MNKIILDEKGKIENLDEILEFINTTNENGLDFLLDLYEGIEKYTEENEYFIPLDFKKVRDALISKLNSYGYFNHQNEQLNLKNVVAKACKGLPLTYEENEYLTNSLETLITKMPNLTFEEQNILDVFVEYVKERTDINSKWREIVFSYYKNVDNSNKQRLLQERSIKENEHRVLKLEKIKKDTKGTVLTISILEITLIIGILLAFLILALV